MIVACVRTGDKYSVQYVSRLRSMVEKFLPYEHQFVCLTDRPFDLIASGIKAIDIRGYQLMSWWGKMALFAEEWRLGKKVLYFDLDTLIVGDLRPLADIDVPFGICESFTRAAGYHDWPCKYGSCVMTIGSGFDGSLFKRFWNERSGLIKMAGKYGDQKVIEELEPNASLLQPLLPRNYFLGYRDLPQYKDAPPVGCSMVIYAGRAKPHSTTIKWAKAAWIC